MRSLLAGNHRLGLYGRMPRSAASDHKTAYCPVFVSSVRSAVLRIATHALDTKTGRRTNRRPLQFLCKTVPKSVGRVGLSRFSYGGIPGVEGGAPQSLIQGNDGNFYGVTPNGADL